MTTRVKQGYNTQVLQTNTHFSSIYEFEILNNVTRACQESGAYNGAIPCTQQIPLRTGLPQADFILTEYEYDANRNRIRVESGEATNGNDPDNVVHSLYNERDLLCQQTRAPGTAEQSTTQYDYDGSRNLRIVREGLEDTPRLTRRFYDGYDRLWAPGAALIDPMGNTTEYHYDPNGNLGGEVDPLGDPGTFHPFAERRFGELADIEGSAGNIRLSQTMHFYDVMDL